MKLSQPWRRPWNPCCEVALLTMPLAPVCSQLTWLPGEGGKGGASGPSTFILSTLLSSCWSYLLKMK